jgi:hypothetical protein
MIIRAYLHGGEARWRVFLVADNRHVDLRHLPFEGFFFVGGHLRVRLFNVPLCLLLEPPVCTADVAEW